MYIIVKIIGNHMGPGILTNIIQGILGAFIYFIITELTYRILKKQSIVTYIQGIIKG